MAKRLAHLTLAIVCIVHGVAFAADDLPLPAPRIFVRGAVIDHHVYLFGGGYNSIDVFDVSTRKWSRIATTIPASKTLYGDQIGGRLYLLDAASRSLHSVDPATGKTTRLRGLSTGRVNSTVIAAGGKLYVIGGYSSDVTPENCVAVYDPQTDTWSAGPPLPGYEPLDHFHCAAVLDGKLHVVGGLLKENRDQPHWRLDGDHWTRLADAPLHAIWKHAGLSAAKGQLYLLCPMAALPNNQGNPDENAANFYRYDPKTDQWHAIGRAPRDTPFAHFIPAVVRDRIHYFGGVTLEGRLSTGVKVFDLKTGRWE